MSSRVSAEGEAYRRIKRALIQKHLLPGQPLSEEWLSHRLNMSRTPVRAALKRLAAEGLIEIVPYRGAFVIDPTVTDIQHLFEVRMLVEGYAAEKAAPICRDEDVAHLRSLLEQERQAYEVRDYEAIIDINTAIHEFPALVTGNPVLHQQVAVLVARGNCYMILKDPFYSKALGDLKVFAEHDRIFQAFANRDPVEAARAIKEHLKSTVYFYTENGMPSVFD